MSRRLLLALIAAAPACASAPSAAPPADRFLRAIEDAALPETDEVRDDLLIVSDDNPDLVWRDQTKTELLTVAVMSADAQKRFYAEATGALPPNRPILWITVAPQLQAFCRATGLSGEGLEMRVKQYLGLDPARTYDTVVTLWLKREDLFRPCADPRTDRAACGLELTQGAAVPRLDDYRAFFEGLYVGAYKIGGAPWTRLGYTYDWGATGGEVGATEFMAAPGTAWTRAEVKTLSEFCR